MRDHVAVLTLPPGTDETGLLAVTEQLRSQRFDPSQPLWRMWFMPGLPAGRVAMFVKLHHSIADGMAAMTTIAAFLNAGPDTAITPASPHAASAHAAGASPGHLHHGRGTSVQSCGHGKRAHTGLATNRANRS
jgi:hypothetical protein